MVRSGRLLSGENPTGVGIQIVSGIPFFPSAMQHLCGLNPWQQSSKISLELIWVFQGLNRKQHHPSRVTRTLEGTVLALNHLNRLGFRLQY